MSTTLVDPISPGQSSRLSISMPPGFAADQEVWVAYELIALPAADDGGELGLEQSFEGVMTPAMAAFPRNCRNNCRTRLPARQATLPASGSSAGW